MFGVKNKIVFFVWYDKACTSLAWKERRILTKDKEKIFVRLGSSGSPSSTRSRNLKAALTRNRAQVRKH